MTANSLDRRDYNSSESAIKSSSTNAALTQKTVRDSQVGAGVLSPKTGQSELPNLLVFTPLNLADNNPLGGGTAKGDLHTDSPTNQSMNSDKAEQTTVKGPDERQIHPFTWMKKDSTQIAQTEKYLQNDVGLPGKQKIEEQKMGSEIQHLYEDLHVVRGRHLAHDANYRNDWKTAYSQLSKVQSDLHSTETVASGSAPRPGEMQQLSHDEMNLQSSLGRLYEPALEKQPPTKPPESNNSGSDNMTLNVNTESELKQSIASGLKFGTVRLWDNGVKINQLMNADGTMNKNSWNNLEQMIDTAHDAGKKVMYTFGETRDAKGECIPPSDSDIRRVTEALTKWSAQQKAAGKPGIDTYELWNEPSYKGFWTGSPEELAHTTGIINQVIRQNDPTSSVASPANSFWGKNAVSWTTQYLAAYKKEYGLDSSTFDQIDFHGYGFQNQAPEQILTDISQMKQVESEFGLQSKPLVDSEDSFGLNSWMSDDKSRADYLARKAIVSEFSGVTPAWYTNDKYGGLDNQTRKDEQTVYGWMDGAKLENLTHNGDIYSATLEKNGKQEEIAWTTSSQPVDFTPGSQYSKYQSLFGEAGNADGTIQLSDTPILLD